MEKDQNQAAKIQWAHQISLQHLYNMYFHHLIQPEKTEDGHEDIEKTDG